MGWPSIEVRKECHDLASRVLEEYGADSIRSLVEVPSKFMFHLEQHSKTGRTRAESLNKKLRDRLESWRKDKPVEARVTEYLRHALLPEGRRKSEASQLDTGDPDELGRLFALCTDFAEVAGVLACVMRSRPAYVIYETRPAYLFGSAPDSKPRTHAINAITCSEGAFHFFDSSVYMTMAKNKIRRHGFQPFDIDIGVTARFSTKKSRWVEESRAELGPQSLGPAGPWVVKIMLAGSECPDSTAVPPMRPPSTLR